MSAHRLQPCPRHTPEITRVFLAVATWTVALLFVLAGTGFAALRFGYDLTSYLAIAVFGLAVASTLIPIGIVVFGQRLALSRAVRSCSICRGEQRG